MPKKADTGKNTAHSGTEEADANVDKIRDILFGGHMRDYDERFATLEKRLTDSIEQSSRNIEKQLERLDARTRKEFDKLAEQLKAEKADRVAGDKDAAAESNQLANQVEGWFAEVEDQLASEAKDIRQTLKQQGSEMTGLLRKLETQLQKDLARETDELSSLTVSRSDLAALLTDVATRISKKSK